MESSTKTQPVAAMATPMPSTAMWTPLAFFAQQRQLCSIEICNEEDLKIDEKDFDEFLLCEKLTWLAKVAPPAEKKHIINTLNLLDFYAFRNNTALKFHPREAGTFFKNLKEADEFFSKEELKTLKQYDGFKAWQQKHEQPRDVRTQAARIYAAYYGGDLNTHFITRQVDLALESINAPAERDADITILRHTDCMEEKDLLTNLRHWDWKERDRALTGLERLAYKGDIAYCEALMQKIYNIIPQKTLLPSPPDVMDVPTTCTKKTSWLEIKLLINIYRFILVLQQANQVAETKKTIMIAEFISTRLNENAVKTSDTIHPSFVRDPTRSCDDFDLLLPVQPKALANPPPAVIVMDVDDTFLDGKKTVETGRCTLLLEEKIRFVIELALQRNILIMIATSRYYSKEKSQMEFIQGTICNGMETFLNVLGPEKISAIYLTSKVRKNWVLRHILRRVYGNAPDARQKIVIVDDNFLEVSHCEADGFPAISADHNGSHLIPMLRFIAQHTASAMPSNSAHFFRPTNIVQQFCGYMKQADEIKFELSKIFTPK